LRGFAARYSTISARSRRTPVNITTAAGPSEAALARMARRFGLKAMRSPIENFLQIAFIRSITSAAIFQPSYWLILYKIVLRAGAGQGHFLFCRTKLLPKAYPELIPFVNPGKSYNYSRTSGQMVRLIARPSGGLVCREAGDLGGRFYTSPDL
jgi:hypothetical protein